MAQDPKSNGESMTGFMLQAESAFLRCNVDKQLTLEYLIPAEQPKCKWYQYNCKKQEK